MAKDKAQRKMQKKLYEWYEETMAEKDLLWNDVTKIIINDYRLSDIKSEKAIYNMLIDIEEELLKEVRWELDKTYKGEPMI